MKSQLKLALLAFSLLSFLSVAHAQETISPDQAANFMRQYKNVCGKVVHTHFASKNSVEVPGYRYHRR